MDVLLDVVLALSGHVLGPHHVVVLITIFAEVFPLLVAAIDLLFDPFLSLDLASRGLVDVAHGPVLLVSGALERGELDADVAEAATFADLDFVALGVGQLLIEKHRRVRSFLEAVAENTGPVVLDEADLLVVVEDPLCVALDFILLQLAPLSVVEAVEQVCLDCHAAEEGEVVAGGEADHALEGILLIAMNIVLVELLDFEDFRERYERL